MQLSAIIEKEKQRGNLFECRIARLYREGMFLRAYNWSAWLFVKQTPDLKISNRQTKSSEDTVTMIGFPPQSIEKFAPEGAQVATNTDGSVDVVFPSSIIPDDAVYFSSGCGLLQRRRRSQQRWLQRLLLVVHGERREQRVQPQLQLVQRQPGEQQRPRQRVPGPRGAAQYLPMQKKLFPAHLFNS